MGRIIEVVDYDPKWIEAFEEEAAALTNVFAPRLLEIHHVGSTSVPTLAAKPIIDILTMLQIPSSFEAIASARGKQLNAAHAIG